VTEENADENPRNEPSGPSESPDGTDPSASEADLLQAKQTLEDQLAQLQKEASETKDRWLRAAADLENFKKRAAREREETLKFGNERLLKDFLPVLDDLDRAIEVMAQSEEGQRFVDGVNLVRKKFLSQLERHDVTSFTSLGEAFDPARHDAVQQVHSAEVEAGRIASELQRGFTIGGRLLRPAMVVVSLGPDSGQNEGPESA
jgi:molecular chaperone GrpE